MFVSVRLRGRDRAASPNVNLAPLMDLVFILLIFFVVTATFTRNTGIRVNRPQATWTDSLDPLSLRVAITAGGAVYVEGRRVDLAALRDRVGTLVKKDPDTSVILIADRELAAGRLVEVMDAARIAGAKNVAVATRRKESP
jgi:biopolymer transport protein ExbD